MLLRLRVELVDHLGDLGFDPLLVPVRGRPHEDVVAACVVAADSGVELWRVQRGGEAVQQYRGVVTAIGLDHPPAILGVLQS